MVRFSPQRRDSPGEEYSVHCRRCTYLHGLVLNNADPRWYTRAISIWVVEPQNARERERPNPKGGAASGIGKGAAPKFEDSNDSQSADHEQHRNAIKDIDRGAAGFGAHADGGRHRF